VYWVVASGGAGSLTVVADADTSWRATSSVPWVTFSGAASGVGTAPLAIDVGPLSDDEPARTCAVEVGDARCMVIQLASPEFLEAQIERAPLPYIEQVALLGILDKLKQAPPPVRAAGLAALVAAVTAMGPAAMALYRAFPAVPGTFDATFVAKEVSLALAFIAKNAGR